jgi:hypothetical protein
VVGARREAREEGKPAAFKSSRLPGSGALLKPPTAGLFRRFSDVPQSLRQLVERHRDVNRLFVVLLSATKSQGL